MTGRVQLSAVLTISLIVIGLCNGDEQSEKELEELVNDTTLFIDSQDFQLLCAASRGASNPYPYISYSRLHLSERSELARLISAQQRPQSLFGLFGAFRRRVRFEKIYDEKVKQPCKTVLELAQRCDNFMGSHPEVDDRDHLIGLFPMEWFKYVEICKKESLEATYREFKMLNRSS